jgi:hypothetical protein
MRPSIPLHSHGPTPVRGHFEVLVGRLPYHPQSPLSPEAETNNQIEEEPIMPRSKLPQVDERLIPGRHLVGDAFLRDLATQAAAAWKALPPEQRKAIRSR